MKKTKHLKMLLVVLAVTVITLAGCQSGGGTSADYKYYSQAQLKSALENDLPLVIFDVQVEADFSADHIEGAIATYAFPVKSDDDKAKIDAQLELLEETDSDIVIICPMGRVGAE